MKQGRVSFRPDQGLERLLDVTRAFGLERHLDELHDILGGLRVSPAASPARRRCRRQIRFFVTFVAFCEGLLDRKLQVENRLFSQISWHVGEGDCERNGEQMALVVRFCTIMEPVRMPLQKPAGDFPDERSCSAEAVGLHHVRSGDHAEPGHPG
jgi:hypothetical protein